MIWLVNSKTSVCPRKMLAAAFIDSAAVVPTVTYLKETETCCRQWSWWWWGWWPWEGGWWWNQELVDTDGLGDGKDVDEEVTSYEQEDLADGEKGARWWRWRSRCRWRSHSQKPSHLLNEFNAFADLQSALDAKQIDYRCKRNRGNLAM